MKVYQRVYACLGERGLKQKAVAAAARIPYATFNAMMNGKRKIYVDELKAICDALGVSADVMIGRETA